MTAFPSHKFSYELALVRFQCVLLQEADRAGQTASNNETTDRHDASAQKPLGVLPVILTSAQFARAVLYILSGNPRRQALNVHVHKGEKGSSYIANFITSRKR